MTWDELYKDPRFCLKEPAEEVIKFLPILKEKKAHRVLDLGFGAGRHVIYLAKEGFEVYGIDISRRGKQLTEEWLVSEGLQAELALGDMTAIPYHDNFFDACVCRGVITHNTISGLRMSIKEIHRILRRNGVVMCTFISRESSEYGVGRELESHTYAPNSGIETGIPHHYTDEAETRALMSCFNQLQLYHLKHSGLINMGAPYVSAHWVFVGEKID